MQSMTGFGQAAGSTEAAAVSVEIKTVNGRYLDINLRLPKELASVEPDLRKELQRRLGRGRVDVFVNLTLKATDRYELNQSLVQNYMTIADDVRALGVTGSLEVTTLLPLPGVVVSRQMDVDSEGVLETLHTVFRQALDRLIVLREKEGEELRKDLKKRIEKIGRLVESIEGKTDEISSHYRQKLKSRLQELSKSEQIDHNRLSQEVVYYLERSDITEEITRLRSHLGLFLESLAVPEGEVVGRRLDFICQEISREINTVLSKSPLADISEPALDGKTEADKIREQVQNVE